MSRLIVLTLLFLAKLVLVPPFSFWRELLAQPVALHQGILFLPDTCVGGMVLTYGVYGKLLSATVVLLGRGWYEYLNGKEAPLPENRVFCVLAYLGALFLMELTLKLVLIPGLYAFNLC